MPENSWPENDSFKAFDGTAIDSSGAAFVPLVDEEFSLEIDPAFLQGVEGRRLKAASVWLLLFVGTYWLHQSPWGYEITLGFALVLAGYCGRLYLGEARTTAAPWVGELPRVSLMVAAKNEASVIAALALQLCALDYPGDRYEVWMIDDASSGNFGCFGAAIFPVSGGPSCAGGGGWQVRCPESGVAPMYGGVFGRV
jgi:1,2-diacylglycerol 3-beta-glucosyltransferase